MIETRKGNGISMAIILPSNLGGFYGQVQYVFGEQLSSAALTRLATTWAHVWATATVLWTQLSVLLRAVALPLPQDADQFNIFASYDLGVVKPFIGFNQRKEQGRC